MKQKYWSDLKTSLTIAIDFDGTMTTYENGWQGHGICKDSSVKGAIEAIRQYMEAGYLVAIFSSRAETLEGKRTIAEWLLNHGFTKGELMKIQITARKIPALIYLDDRGWTFTGKFPSVEEIKNFQPWYMD